MDKLISSAKKINPKRYKKVSKVYNLALLAHLAMGIYGLWWGFQQPTITNDLYILFCLFGLLWAMVFVFIFFMYYFSLLKVNGTIKKIPEQYDITKKLVPRWLEVFVRRFFSAIVLLYIFVFVTNLDWESAFSLLAILVLYLLVIVLTRDNSNKKK